MMVWILRDGTEVDIEAMYRLDLLCFEEPFRFDRATMRWFVVKRGAVVVIAEVDGVLVGFVVVNVEWADRAKVGYVTTLDVAPEWRRSGLARDLMIEAGERVRAAGGVALVLHVFEGNVGAVGFYEASGYERVGLEVGFYGDGLDGWVYRKGL